ncbi:unnamed protein product, partial [Rotaria magnacalcarata]
ITNCWIWIGACDISPTSTMILINIVSSRTYGLDFCWIIANGNNLAVPLEILISELSLRKLFDLTFM